MGTEFGAKERNQVDIHFVSDAVACVVEENFEGSDQDHVNRGIAERNVHQLPESNARSDLVKASTTDSTLSHTNDQSSGEGSNAVNAESQIALDEAYARYLQEVEDHFAATSLAEDISTEAGVALPDVIPAQSSTVNAQPNSSSTPNLVSNEDDVDPDNMTYEQLQSLGEEVGAESRGLSDEVISYLPSSTYRTGFFARRDRNEQCVICYDAYKNRDKLITLPCQHYYHSPCITRWLKMNKACPICNEEVFGS